VAGKEIQVARETLFSERHGKAEVGAYVKMEGIHVNKTFRAYEIEVKSAKK
jgi:hypothetical protein